MTTKPKATWHTIHVKYWSCHNPEHRHKSESVAEGCIGKQKNKSAPQRHWDRAALKNVLEMKRAGLTYTEIGAAFLVSKERARQLVLQAIRKETEILGPFDGLSPRIQNALRCEEVFTVQQLKSALETGLIDSFVNIGKTSIHEIKIWLEGK